MRELIWWAVARIITIPAVTGWLIRRAKRTPYTNITGPDGSLYMGRWWLFNPYGKDENGDPTPARWESLPSARIHHIMRPDSDRHCHDHPWDARTIVLSNGYNEERPVDSGDNVRTQHWRPAGYTGKLLYGQFHRISHIPEGGAWTLFITWPKQGTWGFLVDGVKVPWRQYLGLDPAPPKAPRSTTPPRPPRAELLARIDKAEAETAQAIAAKESIPPRRWSWPFRSEAK